MTGFLPDILKGLTCLFAAGTATPLVFGMPIDKIETLTPMGIMAMVAGVCYTLWRKEAKAREALLLERFNAVVESKEKLQAKLDLALERERNRGN